MATITASKAGQPSPEPKDNTAPKKSKLKQPLEITSNNFDLNFFFVGPSGTGKTDFVSRYTKGPIHFYMFDKGGSSTVKKVLKQKKIKNITLSDYSDSDLKFSDFWNEFQQDEIDGLFDELAEQNGILVTDSITKLNIIAKRELSKISGKGNTKIGKQNKSIKWTFDEWNQLNQWMQTYMNAIQDLPCASVTTVHLVNETDSAGAVVGKSLTLNGAFRENVKIDFDEMYLFMRQGSLFKVAMTEKSGFTAKSNSLEQKIYDDITMDKIFSSYMKG